MGKVSEALTAALVVGLMVVANLVNLGADIGGMGAAMSLLVGGPAGIYATVFAVVSLLLQVLLPYSKYVNVLKWLTLAHFAYVGTVFAVHIPWADALRSTVLPAIHLRKDYLTGLIAVLGTTISPYLFFWQASEEAEEEEVTPGEKPLKRAPAQAARQLQRIRLDTYLGMAFSNLIAFFIILTTGTTLHAHGMTNIATARRIKARPAMLTGRMADM